MPLICIGPVCVPISALLPILAYLARPVWRRLPPPTQQAILAYWKAFAEWTQANVWDRIGWKAAPKRSAPPPSGAADGAAELAEGLRAKRGGVVAMLSEDDWDAAMALSAEVPVVVDFTATWCGPCQRIKPFFEELAAAHKGALFVKVDVDELESVSQAAEVLAMPTFQVYREGQRVDTVQGATTDTRRLRAPPPPSVEELASRWTHAPHLLGAVVSRWCRSHPRVSEQPALAYE